MAGLVPAIHVFLGLGEARTWMPGTRPGMTSFVGKPNSISCILSQTLRMTGTVFVSTHKSYWDLRCSGQKHLHFFPFLAITL
jgi:hypothetical protein